MMDLSSFELEKVHSKFKGGFQYQNTKIYLPAVKSLVRLHGCAGWPGSIMVAKAGQFWYQQVMG
jgi:hypothetical protein